MRVISGECRGRKLLAPEGMELRPTTDQVKEALFNIVQFDIEGRRALDLFAGTGQLGIEALSRGAAACVFVDASANSLKLVRENLKRCSLNGQVEHCNALDYLRRGGKFDLIFIDPPYDTTLASDAMEAVKAFDILSKGGIMVVETRRETALPSLGADFGTEKIYRYGKIKLTVITRGN